MRLLNRSAVFERLSALGVVQRGDGGGGREAGVRGRADAEDEEEGVAGAVEVGEISGGLGLAFGGREEYVRRVGRADGKSDGGRFFIVVKTLVIVCVKPYICIDFLWTVRKIHCVGRD